MKTNNEKPSTPTRILGLDLGERRIGVAISDWLQLTAQGVEVIDKKITPDWLKRLDQLVKTHEVTQIVIGLPRNMNGTLGEKGQSSIQTADLLRERYDFPIELWDERLSTMAVERTLVSADVSRKKRKKVIDQLAASWMLQGYLDALRRK